MINYKKTSSVLFILRITKMLLSLVTVMIIARYFGVSIDRDIWILVSTFLTTISSSIWGPLNETFRAKFIFIRESESEFDAINQTSSLLSFVILITIIVGIVVSLFSRDIALFMMKNFENENQNKFVTLLLLMLPTLLISQISALGTSILNAYNIFYIPEFASIISVVINIPIIILFTPIIGIYSLALSQYISIIVLLVIIINYINKNNLNLKINLLNIKFKYIKAFIWFSLPFFFPYFFGQLNLLAEKWLAGLLQQGTISIIDYARQFSGITQSVLGSVLTTVMVPVLAKSFSNDSKKYFDSALNEFLVISFAIMSIFLPILFGASIPLSDVFFNRGSISPESLKIISHMMQLYAISLIGIVLYMVIGYALLSSKKGKKYAQWGVVNQFVILTINLIFINKVGVYIFPISLGISHLFTAMILSMYLNIDKRGLFYYRIVKYTIVVMFIAILLFYFNKNIHFSSSILQLLISSIFIFCFIPLISFGLGIDMNRIFRRFTKHE